MSDERIIELLEEISKKLDTLTTSVGQASSDIQGAIMLWEAQGATNDVASEVRSVRQAIENLNLP